MKTQLVKMMKEIPIVSNAALEEPQGDEEQECADDDENDSDSEDEDDEDAWWLSNIDDVLDILVEAEEEHELHTVT